MGEVLEFHPDDGFDFILACLRKAIETPKISVPIPDKMEVVQESLRLFTEVLEALGEEYELTQEVCEITGTSLDVSIVFPDGFGCNTIMHDKMVKALSMMDNFDVEPLLNGSIRFLCSYHDVFKRVK